MDRETNDLISRLYLSERNLSEVDTGEFAKWAAMQLERGHNIECVRRLSASTELETSEAERLFRKCLEELGWEIPGKKAALKQHTESILQSIVAGEIEPYDGCSHLYIVSIYLGHPDYLYNWNGLFWAREDIDEDELNELIKEEARRELSGEIAPINEALRRHEPEEEESPGFWERVREAVRWRKA